MASIAPTRVRDLVEEALGSDRRLTFLAKLAWELVVSNRGYYPDPDTDLYRQAGMSICVNEILHNLTSQIWSDLDHGRGGYPDQALIGGMLSKARVWKCEEIWNIMVQRAVERCDLPATASGSVDPSNGLAPALRILASDRRHDFLAELFVQLAGAARDISYPLDAELVPYARGFACTNELLVLVAERLRADLRTHGTAQIDAEFIGTLIDSANARGCGGDLRYLFERTLAATALPSS
jgi:hypothetical protein